MISNPNADNVSEKEKSSRRLPIWRIIKWAIIVFFLYLLFSIVFDTWINNPLGITPTNIEMNDKSFIITCRDGTAINVKGENKNDFVTNTYATMYFSSPDVQQKIRLEVLGKSANDAFDRKYIFYISHPLDVLPNTKYYVGEYLVNLGSASSPELDYWLSTIINSHIYIYTSTDPWYVSFFNYLPTVLMIIIFLSFFMMMFSKGGAGLMAGGGGDGDNVFSIGKSQAKLAISKVKFSDIAGISEEKNELIEIVDYLKHPAKYAAMGARTPKGVILYGPPGTGKTLLAKAVAGEAGVPFFQVSGSAFDDMLVGVGAKRVRDLFNKARKSSPSIVFIDEIDSVASKRGKFDMSGGGGIADQTINQLLAEMDGFSTRTGIVVIAATNRIDVLDEAILRPGRFDRHIQVFLPDIKEREEILRIHARNKNISSSVSFTDIARRTPGMSGAQLENVLNEATLLSVRADKNTVSLHEIDEAIDRVIAGPAKKSRVITESERKQIAIHEAGHAIVGLYTPGSDVVEKITIIPRGQAAGYTVSNPEKQEKRIQTKTDLVGIITQMLGGRAAEQVICGAENISTGAANDLYRATNIARSMVMQLGMSDIALSQLVPSEGTTNAYSQKMYSEATALKADQEVEKIISTNLKKAIVIVQKNKTELNLIVQTLLGCEVILRDQIEYIHKNKKIPPDLLKAVKAEDKYEKEHNNKND